MFNKNLTRVCAVMAAFIMLIGFTGCEAGFESSEMKTTNEADSLAVVEALNNATEIKAEKAPFSIGDKWDIYADGVLIGQVRGVPFYLVGDTYSLYSVDGSFVGAEAENFKLVNSTADTFDHNGDKVGRLESEIFTWLAKVNIFDGENKVGTASQKFGFAFNAEINDMDENVEWKMERAVFSIGASVTITRTDSNETDVNGMNALWASLMMNEIYEAAQSNSGGN